MTRLSTIHWIALAATVTLVIAFFALPLLNAPIYDTATDSTIQTADDTVDRLYLSGMTVLSADDNLLGYPTPQISWLLAAVITAIIAAALSIISTVRRTARYLLSIAGLLAIIAYISITTQNTNVSQLSYAQMLGGGFWLGVFASIILILQGFIGHERDQVTNAIGNFFKDTHIHRVQVLSAILFMIGIFAIVQAFNLFTSDMTTTLKFAPHGFGASPPTEPIQLPLPTQGFIVASGIYLVIVSLLGMLNWRPLRLLVNILLIIAGGLIFLILLVGSAANDSTNATIMITESLRLATPIVIGAMAGIWCERAGVVNIAIEGMMLFGACIGFTTLFLLQIYFPPAELASHSEQMQTFLTTLYMILSIVMAVLTGGLVAMLHAWLSITFATDQIVSGTVINILALGTTSYIRAEVLLSSEAGLNRLPVIELPILSDLPVIGPIFASQPIFYSMFIIIIATHVILFQTKWGLRTRAVGENPHAADTLGIKVNRVRWINVIIGGMIAGLAGAWFTLEATGRFTDGMTNGKGFISLAAMIFGKWTPIGAFGGSLLFGFTDALGFRFQIEDVPLPPQFLQIVPYVVTLIVLAGLVGRAIPPKAVGQPYKTEGSR